MAIAQSVNQTVQAVQQAVWSPTWPVNAWLHALVYIVIAIAFGLAMILVFIYAERRGVARFQIRLGPNRAGPEGLLQAVADLVKLLLKEDIVPSLADKVIHLIAPIVAAIPAFMVFAVVPLWGDGALLSDINVAVLYLVAISSFGALGVFMAGWASSNKYSMISAMRGVAQMVSYEIPLVLASLAVVVFAGTLSLNGIVNSQHIPYILLMPLAAVIYFVAMTAELNRSPFDLLEAESEIIAGYHTEYSGIKFALFYVAEYGHAVAGSAVFATLFLSGWKGPLLPPLLWLMIKMLLVFFVSFWARATLPRIRVDQLMGLGWKGLLPLGVFNVIIAAIEVLFWPQGLTMWLLVPINIVVAILLISLWSKTVSFRGGRVEVRTRAEINA
ncbi:MAG: NADH-quinone oxidoreductase subunit NuoH [Dehalococcoidia bacterium]|nr:NADH-quinone oxidoreductase subunit NuoH [Dehalococcoidia bacterium]